MGALALVLGGCRHERATAASWENVRLLGGGGARLSVAASCTNGQLHYEIRMAPVTSTLRREAAVPALRNVRGISVDGYDGHRHTFGFVAPIASLRDTLGGRGAALLGSGPGWCDSSDFDSEASVTAAVH